MMIADQIRNAVLSSLSILYGREFTDKDFQINQTRPEFKGDYTVVLFSLVKSLRKSPDELGNELGTRIIADHPTLFTDFNLIKGFLNLSVSDIYWVGVLVAGADADSFGKGARKDKRIMVEYSSPNTNKPLHLGHLRNNFLGWSIAEILKGNGYDVVKSCIVNDRGVHICKSMLAWERWGNGATPASTGTKGDHFVGDYYVLFNDEYKKEVDALVAQGMTKELAEKEAPMMKATQTMLVKWEQGDAHVVDLWRRMNGWVYEGFDVTYKKIGSDFDKIYYESDSYLLGKEDVEEGLKKGVFNQKPDGSVWIDLTADGLDEKLVRRKDGTSVYITQDIGLARLKYDQYKIDKSIYVIGDEQNYHMKVLKLICQKLGMPYADDIQHLSYGMVELPTGKMKSREGTVVDADDLVEEMVNISRQHTLELGKVTDFNEAELQELCETLGLGALKFYLLRVDPRKRMIFNPEESIDFHGFTGPFVQYTHARIRSILRKEALDATYFPEGSGLLKLERDLLIALEKYSTVLDQAARDLDPSVLALYVYDLARAYNTFYAEHSVANAESTDKKQLRLRISHLTASVIRSGMAMLGIKVPERM
jgi:arginyl-tRNA synthetase